MTTFDVTVEMFVDGAWLDITRLSDNCRVLSLDQGQRGITMTRGRSSEQGRVAPSTVLIDYLDTEAVLDWDNPNSPYWRKIGLSTPVRVKVDGDIRCAVELAALRPSWEDNSDNVQVQIEGAGVLRRLEAQGKPLLSPLTRYFTRNPPWQWWPMETGSAQQVTTITSALTGGVALTTSPASAGSSEGRLSGIISGGTTAGPDGSLSAVDSSGGGQLEAILPGSGTTGFRIEGCFRFDTPVSDDIADGEAGQIFRTHFGAGNSFGLFFYPGIGLLVETYDPDVGPDSADNIAVTVDDGAWHHVRVDLTPSGGGTDTACVVTVDGETAISTTFTGLTHGPITDLTISPTGEVDAVCHWAVWEVSRGLPASATGSADAFKAYRGYLPFDFMGAIAADEGVPFFGFPAAPLNTNLTLGPIGAGTFMDQIHEANKAAQGIIFEQRNENGVLNHSPKDTLYNRLPAVRLTYGQLQPGFRPVGDDQWIVNDMTATNPDGDSQRYVIPDGDHYHWSTEDAPTGAGMRDQQDGFTVDGVADLDELAAWWAHLGSWREKRFPQVTVELAKDVFDADTRQAIANLEIGDVIAIDTTGAPKWVPYNEIRLMIQGYTEQVSRFSHVFTFNTTPADVYEVSIVDSGSTSTLAMPMTTVTTSIKIAPGDGPAWSEADEPYHISIDGQPMTVTAISTDTPAFIAAGAASFADNASVVPALPAGITPDVGQLLLCFAASRETGSGEIGSTVSGWTLLASPDTPDSDWRLFGRYYQTGDTAPTITVSGGAAGNTVGAVVLAFSGLSMTLDKNKPGGYSNGYVISENSSAQNILYPAYLARRTNTGVLLIGKKDDDWTSVATIAGTSELVDASSTTGNDLGIVVDFYNPGTPTTVISQSFSVTGGASAISVGIVVGLRPLQTATVTRDIAGVLTAEAVGAAVHAWRPGAIAL